MIVFAWLLKSRLRYLRLPKLAYMLLFLFFYPHIVSEINSRFLKL